MQYTILNRAAMSQQQKMAILSNELVRRLSNIHPEVLSDELEEVVEHYVTQLKNSGYDRKQSKEVIVCGIVGWRRKLERRQKKGQAQYLEAKETLEKMAKEKLMEKTRWYKVDKKRKLENEQSRFKLDPPAKRRRKGKQEETKNTTTTKKIKGVMFVPYTRHSELALRLRENEEKMENLTGYRIKIVEKGGTKLVDILHKANPWAGQDCGRDGCLLCRSRRDEGRKDKQDCRKRNMVYQTTCQTCKERKEEEIEEKYKEEGKKKVDEMKKGMKKYIYIGESNRSAFEIGREHHNDIAANRVAESDVAR